MPLRPATKADIPTMSRIAAQAFWDDELFGDCIHPYRHQYPDDVMNYWLALIRKAWNDSANTFLISTAQDGEVAAWCQWTRKGCRSEGEDPVRKQVKWEDLPPNRAAHPDRITFLERSYDYIGDKWSGPRAEAWDIALLATSPSYQGQGHGKLLMQWGIEQATREQVPMSVISALGRDGFYNMLGYTIPDGTAQDGEGNPLSGLLKGGNVYWKEDHLRGKS